MVSPTPEELSRIRRLERLLAEVRVPVFGHMRLDTGLRQTDVLLGAATRISAGLTLIDWQNAPLAEVFFGFDEGQPYEVEVEERLVSGRLLEKNLLGFHHGELSRVTLPAAELVRVVGGWQRRGLATRSVPQRPREVRRPFRSPLEVQLDPAQQRAVDLPPANSLLLLGEAGFGKTTVALHRIVALEQRGNRAFQGAVLVPTEGLRRLTEMMLLRRGETRVEVFTYDSWARQLARRAFRGLPRRESQSTSPGVARLKRHPALRPVLAEFARRHSFVPTGRADLEHFFGDRVWMDRVVAMSDGQLPLSYVDQVIAHTKAQFRESAETQFAHVDSDRLEALDGRRLDAGTPDEDANSVDPEDYAVLFELERLRGGRAGGGGPRLARYDCVLVDEAQEFSPIELALMRRTLRPHGTVIVAGDAAQQVDPSSFFAGWDGVLAELGAPDAARVTLEVNYRCPPDVTELARSLVEPGRSPDTAEPSITRAAHDNLFHLCVWLADQLTRLETEDPSASIAVICRTREGARSLAHALRHAVHVRLALEGDFEFRPGLTVTAVPEVKGLEFDYVVVPDVASSTYPDTRESRRALYVAVTRATHRLGLATAGPWSSLLLTEGRPGAVDAAPSAPPG